MSETKKSIKVAAAVIINKDDCILCGKRKQGYRKGLWEFPGGNIKDDDDPEIALINNLKENLGLQVSIKRFIGESKFEYTDLNVDLKLYECSIIKGNIDQNAHSDLKWIKRKELNKLEWSSADIDIVDAIMV